MEKPQRWQFQFSDSILNSTYGPVFVAARRNGRGLWIIADNLPEYVRQYLNIVKRNATWHFSEPFSDTPTLRQVIHNSGEILHWYKDAKCKGLVNIPDPSIPPKPTKIPRNVPAIRNLRQLCDHFSADEPRSLNRRLYKDTECGASISLYLSDGTAIHNGDKRWDTLLIDTPIRGFTIQTIIEGSDATVDSSEFVLPVTTEYVDTWVKEMEATANELWHDANDEEEDNVAAL